MNYNELTDFEINKLVAERLGLNCAKLPTGRNDNWLIIINDKANTFKNVDYCKNPSDAWPIILENNISVVNYCGGKNDWYAVNHDFDIESNTTDKPLRAAMIVYLMMEED